LGDDPQPVVFKVSKAVGSPLDELHLAMDTFGDAVVTGGPPHAGDRFNPLTEGGCQGLHRLDLVGLQLIELFEQLADEFTALFFGLVLLIHEVAQAVHLLVEGCEDGVVGKEGVEPLPLAVLEFSGCLAEGGEVATVGLERS